VLYIAIRRVPAQTADMGIHHKNERPQPLPEQKHLTMVQIMAWTVGDRTAISAVGVYEDGERVVRHNLGADMLDYQLLRLPSLGQVVWSLGDEVMCAWRELSSPK